MGSAMMLGPLIGLSRFGLSSYFNSARSNGRLMRNVLTGVDVGTSKICVLIAEIEPEGGIAVLGYGIAPCTGIRRGVVANIEATVEGLRAAISEAQKSAGVGISAATVSISGAHIHGLNSHGIVAVRGGEVGPRDIQRVIDAARAVAIPLDREVLHILPQQFAVDDQERVRDPTGMAGVRLEARIHIVTATQSYSQNLKRCCSRAGISVLGVIFAPLASAETALFPEECELGVALVDIGGGTTDIVVFHNGAVMHTAALPIGGAHVTSDIADGLHAPMSEAERLKVNYGLATELTIRRSEMVQMPGIGGRSPRGILRQHLSEIIEPRMEEIFAMAQRELLRSGAGDSLGSGVVLVGGTSLLEGAQELAERIFNLPVRRGLPTNASHLPEELMKPMYTTAAGLLLNAAGWHGSANGVARYGRWGWLRSQVTEWIRDFF
jgi:cell division protein FtsA